MVRRLVVLVLILFIFGATGYLWFLFVPQDSTRTSSESHVPPVRTTVSPTPTPVAEANAAPSAESSASPTAQSPSIENPIKTFEEFKARFGTEWTEKPGGSSFTKIYADGLIVGAGRDAQSVRNLLESMSPLLGVTKEAFSGEIRESNAGPIKRFSLSQSTQGLPVYGAGVSVSVRAVDNAIFMISVTTLSVTPVDASPSLSAARAIEAVEETHKSRGLLIDRSDQLMLYKAPSGSTFLVWRLVGVVGRPEVHSVEVLADAHTGEIRFERKTQLN